MAEQSEARAHDRVSTRPTDATLSFEDPSSDGPSAAPATVAFTYAPGAPVAGNPVLFEADAPADGTDASYEWAFGDGASATGAKASRVYDSGGERTVTLTVTDEDGATRAVERRVTVYREVAVEVGDVDGDGLLAVTVAGTEEFDPADEVAVESLRFGPPTAVAAGSGARPVDAAVCDGGLRVRVRADETGLRTADSPGRLAGHTTSGTPIAGTADRR